MNTVKCPRCNLTNWASDVCKRCGLIFSQNPAAERSAPEQSYGGYEQNYSEPVYKSPYSTQSVPQGGQPKTGLAIASMVLSLVGCTPIGLVMGIVALVKASRRPHEYGGQGFAIAGVALGAVSTLFIPIIAAISIPNLMAARRAANEGSAISALRTLYGAEQTYIATMGAGTCGELTQLGSSQLVDPTLARGRRSGYRFEVVMLAEKRQCEVSATPETSSTGTRSFIMTSDGVLHAANKRGAKADRSDPPLGSSPNRLDPGSYGYDR